MCGAGQDFLAGTFFPALRAFESPMAIACLGLVTFLPLRPDFSLPFFISLISVSTFLPAEGEYFRPDDFFAEDFFEDVRLFVVLFAEELFPALLFFAEELPFLVLLDLFFAAFFVAIEILPRKSDGCLNRVSCLATVISGVRFAAARLHNPTQTRQPHQRIGHKPARHACEQSGHRELDERRRDPMMKQEADADQHGRMNDVYGIGAPVQP